MEQELFEGAKKHRKWALEMLCQENLKRSWFLCYRLAGDSAGAAPLLMESWKDALESVAARNEPPKEDFETILSGNILSRYEKGLVLAEEFEALPPPQVAKPYRALVGEVERVPLKVRPYYWMYAYGGMTPEQIAQATGQSGEKLAEQLSKEEETLSQRRARWNVTQRAAYVRLTTQFRDAGGNGFQEVQLPESLLTTLWKQVGLPVKPAKKRKKKMVWTKKRLAVLGVGVGIGAVVLAVGDLVLILCV